MFPIRNDSVGTLSVSASLAPLTGTVRFCLADCLLHEENFSVRCPKHKVSQSPRELVLPTAGVGKADIGGPRPPCQVSLCWAPGLRRVERPSARGRPAAWGVAARVVWGAGEACWRESSVCLSRGIRRSSSVKPVSL